MTRSNVPPFVRIPAHVDGSLLYGAAQGLEAKLLTAMPSIDEALSELQADTRPGYWKSWFRRKSGNFLSYLQIYAHIISMSIPKSRTNVADLRLLDFGGGWGLMSMLPREAGVGHVTYLDNNPDTLEAARIIGDVLGLPSDEYVCGSEDQLFTRETDRFDSVVSSDVLEHVYDIDNLFKALSRVCSPGAYMFHQTGANPKSPYQRANLMRMHRRVETENPKELSELHALGDRALWEERKEFIGSFAPEITEPDLHKLAIDSRGLDRDSLQTAINDYVESGKFPVPLYTTNTCYLNGYWLERLMDPHAVARQLSRYGCDARITSTFWGPGRSSFAKRIIKHGLNSVSYMSTGLSLRVSFYYGVLGIKK